MSGPRILPAADATPAQLVSWLCNLYAEQEVLKADVAKVEAQLIGHGKGRYLGEKLGEGLTVVAAAASSAGKISFDLEADDEDDARKLAGDHFGTIFERVVLHKPREGFAALCQALLTPAKARKLLDLCQRIGKAFAGRAAYVK